jgi:hypothetical protein
MNENQPRRRLLQARRDEQDRWDGLNSIQVHHQALQPVVFVLFCADNAGRRCLVTPRQIAQQTPECLPPLVMNGQVVVWGLLRHVGLGGGWYETIPESTAQKNRSSDRLSTTELISQYIGTSFARRGCVPDAPHGEKL